MSSSVETCNCDLCVDLRRALADNGITDLTERSYVYRLAVLNLEMCDVMSEADDEGFDLSRPAVEACLTQMFPEDEDTPTHH